MARPHQRAEFSAAFLEELRTRLPVSEVVGRRVKLKKAGREWTGLSPFNQERTPSFTVNDQKGFYHDFSSGRHGDIFGFVMDTEGVTFPEAVERLASVAGLTPAKEWPTAPIEPRAPVEDPGRDAEARRRSARANEWFNEAKSVNGTAAQTVHLPSRGITELAPGIDGRVLRFHPACPFGPDERHPCMVAIMRDIQTNEPKAIHRTALSATGIKIGRKVYGPKAGTAIKLSPDYDVTHGLTVGEGIETVLTGMRFGFAPAWALGTAGELSAFPVLAGIEALHVLVDNDLSGTGQRCANDCSARWSEAGREVLQIIPNRLDSDLNDIIRGAAA